MLFFYRSLLMPFILLFFFIAPKIIPVLISEMRQSCYFLYTVGCYTEKTKKKWLMWDTCKGWVAKREQSTLMIQINAYIQNSQKFTMYDKRYPKKAGECSSQNDVSITSKMSIAICNVWRIITPKKLRINFLFYCGLFVLILVVFVLFFSSFTMFRPNFTSGLLQVILPRPRIGMLSLVTVSPVITAFHSCCLSHCVFD